MRMLVALLLLIGLVGCGSEVKLKGAPVSVSGTVSQGGKPIGGIVVVLQPLGDGHVRELPIQKDGSFHGELVSGEYAYYVARPAVLANAQSLKNLASKYFEADLSRTITAEAGKQLAIALD
jgi:hypothetical protein